MLPTALIALIDAFARLPGVGPRTAERYAYHVFKSDPQIATELSRTLADVHQQVAICPVTFALIDHREEVSPLYSDPERDRQLIIVVEDPLDIIAVERTKLFRGTYHVLGGVISPIDNVGPEQLHIPELLERIRSDEAREVILATNASVEGESTALYLQRQIQESGVEVKLSRLARGLPVGLDLEYADQITLSHALEGRKEL